MAHSTPSKSLTKGAGGTVNRAQIVDANFAAVVNAWNEPFHRRDVLAETLSGAGSLTGAGFIELLDSQMLSRHLDFEARAMRSRDEGFYTIGSAGHEGNAAVARALRPTDPALLHYRSGGFMMERARQVEGVDAVYDTALSLAASAEDPIAGGRHKVWGSVPLWVLPQTSTIASHLPKAVGTAIALAQAGRCGVEPPVPSDSVVVCSFGDASVNHAAALAAFNSAAWSAHQQLPCPILFVCEDNGIGISVKTPGGWVEANFRNRAGLRYFSADGLDLVEAFTVAEAAADYVRGTRRPAFLHLSVVRLLGHAGSDVESRYRPMTEIEAAEAQDPLLNSARTALREGLLSGDELIQRYEDARHRVQTAAARAARTRKLATREEVVAPLAPYDPERVHKEATRADYAATRRQVFGDAKSLPERQPPRHLAVQINRALHDLLVKYPQAILFGEDVARKGGVYTLTSDLHARFGGHRVFNTLLDETTILGVAQGAATLGLLPIPEIQYLAYYHNACDQIRGEAASLQFFSNGQYASPMLLRIASLAYQKGFGGHFHNDNSIAALRDIPGLIIACPSRGDDAAMMLRTAAALSWINGRVVAFLEPIALYMTKDLHEPRDGVWQFDYPAPDRAVALGEGRVYHPDAGDLLIVTYGNGVPMSLRVAKRLETAIGRRARVLDLRWLKPLNRELIAQHARALGRVLIVDEGRRTGGIAEEIVTALSEDGGDEVTVRRVAGADSFIPLAAAANLVLVGEEEILEAARALLDA